MIYRVGQKNRTVFSKFEFKMICMQKWTSSLKSVVFWAQCRYTKIAQRIFKYSDIHYTSLTPDKILNSLIYRTLFYVNIYGSYELLKTVRSFGPPCRRSGACCQLPQQILAEFGRQTVSGAAFWVKNHAPRLRMHCDPLLALLRTGTVFCRN